MAVFVDGCFWHRCPTHATHPTANADWWREKLEANAARDRRNDHELADAGWTNGTRLEHEPADEAADRVQNELKAASRVRPPR